MAPLRSLCLGVVACVPFPFADVLLTDMRLEFLGKLELVPRNIVLMVDKPGGVSGKSSNRRHSSGIL